MTGLVNFCIFHFHFHFSFPDDDRRKPVEISELIYIFQITMRTSMKIALFFIVSLLSSTAAMHNLLTKAQDKSDEVCRNIH